MPGSDIALRFYPEARFGGFTRGDGTVAFYTRVKALLDEQAVALDIGCGRGSHNEDTCNTRRGLVTLRGHCAKAIGIDPDPIGTTNPLLDEFRHLTDPRNWPVESASVDLAVADFVLEHVEDVEGFFSECWRVLRPGGYLCIRTPNANSYVGLVSRMVPDRLRGWLLRRAQPQRAELDIFPTHYRCNTPAKLRRALRRCGFDYCVYCHEGEPCYFQFSSVLYAVAAVCHRFVPEPLMISIFAFARKPPAPK